MGCSMVPQEYVFTVTANTDDGDPGAGLFNPISTLLDLSKFDRARATVEVLSYTPNIVLTVGGRASTDGVTFTSAMSPPSMPNIDPSEDPWFRSSWIAFTEGSDPSPDFIQFGLFALLNGVSTSRAMAVVRLRLEFKMGT